MEKSWVSCATLKFSGMKAWWYMNILRSISRSWEWWVPTVRLHLCFDDFTRENSENCPCWGASQDPFLVYSGGFLLKASQYMSKHWFYGIKSFSFLFRPRGGHLEPPWPPGVSDKTKSGIWHPRDQKPSQLNAGQVSWLDFCATLGVSDAPLLSYKVYKFKENMAYHSRLQNTAFFGRFDTRYHSWVTKVISIGQWW